MNLWGLLFENKGLRQTIFKNTFWLFFGQTASRVFKFFLVVYAARVLGVEGYGSFSFILSFVALTFIFSDVGVNALLIREYAKNVIDRGRLLSTSFYLKVILIAVSVVASIVLSFSVKDPIAASVFWLILGLYIFDVFRDFLTSMARAMEKMQLESVILIFEAFLTTILGFLFLYNTRTVSGLAQAYVLGALFSFVLAIVLFRRHLAGAFSYFDVRLARKILVMAWPFAFGTVIGFSLTQIDVVMIGWLKNPEAVGQYSVGSRIVQILFLTPGLVGSAILPVLSRFAAEKERVAAVVQKSLSFVMLLTVPIIFGGIALSSRIIPAIFGKEFLLGADAFLVLLFVLGVFSVTIVMDYLLLSLNLQKKNMEYTAIAAGLNVVLNFLFIIYWGIVGAAIATFLSQAVNLFLTARLSKKVLSIHFFPARQTFYYIIAAILMTAFVFFFWFLSIWFLIPLAALFYFVVLYAMRAPVIIETLELMRLRHD